MSAVSGSTEKARSSASSEEILDSAIDTVYSKLKQVNHSSHIVALSQELRELLRLRKEMG